MKANPFNATSCPHQLTLYIICVNLHILNGSFCLKLSKCAVTPCLAEQPEEGSPGKVVTITLTLLTLLIVVLAIVVYYRRRIAKLKNPEHNVHYMANPDDPQGNPLLRQSDPLPYPSMCMFTYQIILQETVITSITPSILIE